MSSGQYYCVFVIKVKYCIDVNITCGVQYRGAGPVSKNDIPTRKTYNICYITT